MKWQEDMLCRSGSASVPAPFKQASVVGMHHLINASACLMRSCVAVKEKNVGLKGNCTEDFSLKVFARIPTSDRAAIPLGNGGLEHF